MFINNYNLMAENSLEKAQAQKGSKLMAFVFSNLNSFFLTATSALFKYAALDGVSNYDFAVFRTFLGSILMGTLLLYKC